MYDQIEMATTNPVGRNSFIDFAPGRCSSDLACLVGQARRSMADASPRDSD